MRTPKEEIMQDKKTTEPINSKLKALRDTVKAALWDKDLYESCERVGEYSMVSPVVLAQALVIEKYGDPPNEILFNDRDVELMKASTVLHPKWKGQKTMRIDYPAELHEIRTLLEMLDIKLAALISKSEAVEQGLDMILEYEDVFWPEGEDPPEGGEASDDDVYVTMNSLTIEELKNIIKSKTMTDEKFRTAIDNAWRKAVICGGPNSFDTILNDEGLRNAIYNAVKDNAIKAKEAPDNK